MLILALGRRMAGRGLLDVAAFDEVILHALVELSPAVAVAARTELHQQRVHLQRKVVALPLELLALPPLLGAVALQLLELRSRLLQRSCRRADTCTPQSACTQRRLSQRRRHQPSTS